MVYEYFWGKSAQSCMTDTQTHTYNALQGVWGGHWLQCVLPSAQMGRETSRQNLSIRLKDQQPNVSAHEQQPANNKHQWTHAGSLHLNHLSVRTQIGLYKNTHWTEKRLLYHDKMHSSFNNLNKATISVKITGWNNKYTDVSPRE